MSLQSIGMISKINYAAIQSVMDLFGGQPCGSITGASDSRAHERSGNFISGVQMR